MLPLSAATSVDLSAFEKWLRDHLDENAHVTEVAALAGGTQNLMMSFRFGRRAMVLRRAPSTNDRSARALAREGRILSALGATSVPHPRLVASCMDASVLGAAFLIVEKVDGVDLMNPPASVRWGPLGDQLGLGVIDALLELRALEVDALGLDELRRPSDWPGEQLTRWADQLASYDDLLQGASGRLRGIEVLRAWLEDRKPARWELGLVHGDVHLGNALIDPVTGSVRALVDWELASLGDPLLDLGHLLVTWPGAGVVPEMPTCPRLALTSGVVERYRQGSGRDLSDLVWFKSLAAYRLAVVLEGTFVRSLVGEADIGVGEHLHELALRLVRSALARSRADERTGR